MNDIEYRILRAQAGKGDLPDCTDPAVLEIAAALVDAKLVRGDVVRAFEPIPPGVTLGPLTHAGLEALDAEERAREERRVLARLATRGDRLLMAVLVALLGLLLQRWLAPEVAPCRCGREREEQHGERAESDSKVPVIPQQVPDLASELSVLPLGPVELCGTAFLVETNAPDHIVSVPVSIDVAGGLSKGGEVGDGLRDGDRDAVGELVIRP